MREWLTEFKKYLSSSYPSGPGLAVPDDLRAAVCENISIYMEEFQPYLNDDLNDVALAGVRSLLVNNVSSSQNDASRDRLAVSAMVFLTAVSKSVLRSLFREDGILLQICQNFVIPNVRLRDDDEELFEMNYMEYIRRDMAEELKDTTRRRRVACKLLKGIAANYKDQVTSVVSAQIQNLLNSYASNPAENWKDKECAIHLVVYLARKSLGGGVVDVESFFASVIVPELESQDDDVNSCPMLKAGALRFCTLLRNQIPKQHLAAIQHHLPRFLVAESNVVHSYAARCIEKVVLVKNDAAAGASSDLAPGLMNNLFNALKLPESEENQYIIKCIMRVIGVAETNRGDMAVSCIIGLTSILNVVCKNPQKNPVFNHYLFESVALLVKRACERDRALVPTFEEILLPSLELILEDEYATEFLPYAFQLLAQLVDLNDQQPPPIPPIYMQIFNKLLVSPPESCWNTRSNVRELVRLLQALIQKAPHELLLDKVVGIFNRLISPSSSLSEDQGLHLLGTVILNIEFDANSPYMVHIWASIFSCVMEEDEAGLSQLLINKSLVIFMSRYLIKHGPGNLIDSMNTSGQGNIFMTILEKCWIPGLRILGREIEVKLAAVASCRLICESPLLLDPAAASHWGKMLDSIVTILSRKPDEVNVPFKKRLLLDMEPEFMDGAYTKRFVPLYNVWKEEDDPLKDVRDPKQFLVSCLSRLTAYYPGRFQQIINQNLHPKNQTALLQLCNTYNSPIQFSSS